MTNTRRSRRQYAITITLKPGRYFVRAPIRIGKSVRLVGQRNLVKRSAGALHDEVFDLVVAVFEPSTRDTAVSAQ